MSYIFFWNALLTECLSWRVTSSILWYQTTYFDISLARYGCAISILWNSLSKFEGQTDIHTTFCKSTKKYKDWEVSYPFNSKEKHLNAPIFQLCRYKQIRDLLITNINHLKTLQYRTNKFWSTWTFHILITPDPP